MGEAKRRREHEAPHEGQRRPWSAATRQRVRSELVAWWASQHLTRGQLTVGGPPWWDGDTPPDALTVFRTAADGWLLFHTTASANAEPILRDGFEDRTCLVGYAQRPSQHGVYFGMVPPIPVSIDYFDPRLMTADAIAWLVVEAPPEAWPGLALSHAQAHTWPLYQVCYRAEVVNRWPRRRLLVSEVVGYRPELLLEWDGGGGQWLEEAIAEGWLPPVVLEHFHREEA
jgi:hypothetical protein